MSFPKSGKMQQIEGFFVAESAQLLGDVSIGRDSNIWFHTVLRADDAPIQVGSRTNIQDLTMVHPEPGDPIIIGDEVTIGHRAMIHCKQIGNRCLIGMGSILLGWAQIGEESIIAAGALVREKQMIPPRSVVVGVPGKIVRQVSDAEVAMIRRSAAGYVEKVKQYLLQT